MQFRPMKGEKVSDEELPLLFQLAPYYWLSLKLDGIRCLVKDGKALTAALKPLPNRHTREFLESDPRFEGFDGELLLREDCDFNLIDSAFMTEEGEPDFIFHVFDLCSHTFGAPFEQRMDVLTDRLSELRSLKCFKRVHHIKVKDLEHLRTIEAQVLARKIEGVMLRRPDRPYKFGKASINQGHLLKRKPTAEMECIVIGFEEGNKNNNEATINERGLTARSSHKAGKVPNGMLGKFLVRNTRFGDFKVSPGQSNHELRRHIMEHPEEYRHKIIRFHFQEKGTIDKPRSPNYMYFRDPADMDPALVAELEALI